MKFIYTILFFCVSHLCQSQKVLIPYRVDTLFGLSDENGKIVLQPAYDNISWMEGSWFKTFKKIPLNDTMQTTSGKFIRNTTTRVSGLINNGKVILTDEPFDDYEIIIGKCIVAVYRGQGTNLTKEQYKKYGDTRKLFSLFNLEGENVYPENFQSIRKMDTAGISSKNKSGARYILFWATHFNNNYSLFVFDCDKQQIDKWLVKNARGLRPEPKGVPMQFMLGITDSVGNMSTQLVDYSSGGFELKPTLATVKPRRKDYDDIVEVGEGSSGSGSGTGVGRGWDDAIVEAPREDFSMKRAVPAFTPYHIFVKDSLFYITGKESKTKVELPAGAKVIRLVPYSMTQYQPVIVIADNHFYIVKDDRLGKTMYDSLIYFDQYFLAWKKVDGKTKAGVINISDSVIIPFQYDSLYAGITVFTHRQ